MKESLLKSAFPKMLGHGFLLMWTIFKVFIAFVTILFLFYVLFWP